ncbi:MAG: hypothetical protein HQK53_12440 [Oligoflexia bacterium]|nr:hypothetical protein [Oligoflexia bacterium]
MYNTIFFKTILFLFPLLFSFFVLPLPLPLPLILNFTYAALPKIPTINTTSVHRSIYPFSLKTEYISNPLGIDKMRPRFSWKLASSSIKRAETQSAYQILVSSTKENLTKNIGDVWDSGKVISSKMIGV